MAEIKIYTDGAVKNNGGEGTIGMAAILTYIKSSGEEKVLRVSYCQHREYATNNQAELGAISLGLDQVAEDLRYKVDLKIYSDSQWAINSITGEFKATKNTDLIQKIRQQLKDFRSYEFTWVKGHDGDKWNEEANKLAQKSAGTWKG